MECKYFKYFKSKLIFGKYSIKHLIAKGSFGEVYFGTNKINGKNYALKVEETDKNNSLLKDECYTLLNLRGPGIPSVISFGVRGKFSILVENLLGESIRNIWIDKDKKFNLNDTCIFAIQAISILEHVHSNNYLHRDIQPSNFLVGKPDNYRLYLIDFGNAKKYKSSRTGKHVKILTNRGISGSLVFLSLNSMKGIEQTRRDELISLGLVIINLYIGSLPWTKTKYKNLKQGFDKIIEAKAKISIENICKGMPQEMISYMKYVKNLKNEECPDYEYLRKLFFNVLKKIGVKEQLFSWADKIKSPKKIISKKRFKSFAFLSDNLIKQNFNKSSDLNKDSNINEKKKINNKNITDIIQMTDIISKSVVENNTSNIPIDSKNKNNNIKIIVNNEPETRIIKKNNNQVSKNLVKSKKKPCLVDNNEDQKNIFLSTFKNNNNDKKIYRFISEKNLDNYVDELYNKDKSKNEFKTNINIPKKEENSITNNKIKNIINIKNINKNINNNNKFRYIRIFNNNKTQILNNNKKNKINHLLKNTSNNYSYFKNSTFSPTCYRPFFSNKFSNPDSNLSGLTRNLNQFKTIKLEKDINYQFKFTTLQKPINYTSRGKDLEKDNTYHKEINYHSKFYSQTEFKYY